MRPAQSIRQSTHKQFQSTHPSWGATRLEKDYDGLLDISIHAPIVGCDFCMLLCFFLSLYFNPRTHRGVRLVEPVEFPGFRKISIHAPIVGCDFIFLYALRNYQVFQSTHPSWGATACAFDGACACCISIHAPIVGCDLGLLSLLFAYGIFQSTHPSWGATKRFK